MKLNNSISKKNMFGLLSVNGQSTMSRLSMSCNMQIANHSVLSFVNLHSKVK